MKIILQGSNGKLGSEISKICHEKQIAINKVTRNILSSQKNFEEFMNSIEKPHIYLDVSLPDGTSQLCDHLSSIDKKNLSKIHALIIGTTGHNENCLQKIEKVSRGIPVCVVSNFSKGIYLFDEILNAKTSQNIKVADLMKKLGFSIGLLEVHHEQKKDAPSGTAKTLNQSLGLEENKIASWRIGQVFGEHEVRAVNEDESLTIKHIAQHRKIFAEGALDLARNIYQSDVRPGFLKRQDYMIL